MWTENFGPKEEQILAWAMAQGIFRWTDLINEFEKNRDWAHATLMNHWNKMKHCFEKPANQKTGFMLKEEFRTQGSKTLLRTRITQGELTEIEVPLGRYEKVVEFVIGKFEDWYMSKATDKGIVEHHKLIEERPIELVYKIAKEAAERSAAQYKAEGLTRGYKIKEPISDPTFFEAYLKVILTGNTEHAHMQKERLKTETRSRLMEMFKNVKIELVYSLDETSPCLTDEDLSQLLNIMASKMIDENKGKLREKPFSLVISYPKK